MLSNVYTSQQNHCGFFRFLLWRCQQIYISPIVSQRSQYGQDPLPVNLALLVSVGTISNNCASKKLFTPTVHRNSQGWSAVQSPATFIEPQSNVCAVFIKLYFIQKEKKSTQLISRLKSRGTEVGAESCNIGLYVTPVLQDLTRMKLLLYVNTCIKKKKLPPIGCYGQDYIYFHRNMFYS